MTLLVFILAVAAVYVARWNGVFTVVGDLDVYEVAFYSTLLCATLFAFHSAQRRLVVGAVVLCAAGVGSQFMWKTEDPVMNTAIMDLTVACFFLVFGREKWQFQIAVIFGISTLIGYITYLGFIPDRFARNSGDVIAWSHPDILAILGHFASIVLGAGAGDGGRNVTIHLRTDALAFNWRDRLVSSFTGITKG